ncbi:hypothetical protein D3C72_2191670 [compost metagenome]
MRYRIVINVCLVQPWKPKFVVFLRKRQMKKQFGYLLKMHASFCLLLQWDRKMYWPLIRVLELDVRWYVWINKVNC